MEVRALIERVRDLPYSELSHHQRDCCSNALLWLHSMDRANRPERYRHTPPAWIGVRCDWGPSSWPLFWCEAVQSEELDCGALAAISRDVLISRGSTAMPVQLIQRFNSENVENWRRRWFRAGCSPEWALGDIAYHEAVGILREGFFEVWDPVDRAMVKPGSPDDYGGVCAIRVSDTGRLNIGSDLIWGTLPLHMGKWIVITQEPS